MTKPRIALITPALAAANNGNWHTARRWASMLEQDYDCDIALTFDALPEKPTVYAALLALHAKRSAVSIADFARESPGKPIVLALTGTDLYRDIATDTQALHSLELAHTLIVLQEQAVHDVPAAYRHKVVNVFQSCPRPAFVAEKTKHQLFEVVVVGHLRSEKSPETVFAVAARLAQAKASVRISHVGAGLDATLAVQAQSTQSAYPAHYRWLGALSHEASLQAMANADVLLHPSLMEGGANAIIEAIQHATPVLASRIAGNVGLLGGEYAGYFEVGNEAACTQVLLRAAHDEVFLSLLAQQCALRSPLFSPENEANAVREALHRALQSA